MLSGIDTEIRPDHDEKNCYEIDHAALLIFGDTNEGFDDKIGNHFRKLAVEQNRGKNMVLVVNKPNSKTSSRRICICRFRTPILTSRGKTRPTTNFAPCFGNRAVTTNSSRN